MVNIDSIRNRSCEARVIVQWGWECMLCTPGGCPGIVSQALLRKTFKPRLSTFTQIHYYRAVHPNEYFYLVV